MFSSSVPEFTNPVSGFVAAASLHGDWAVMSQGLPSFGIHPIPSGNNLDKAIAHEMDHSLHHVNTAAGITDFKGHLIVNGVVNETRTINDLACSGL
jgi:hypothetical protein